METKKKNFVELFSNLVSANRENASSEATISKLETDINNIRYKMLSENIAEDLNRIGTWLVRTNEQNVNTTMTIPIPATYDKDITGGIDVSIYVNETGFHVALVTPEATRRIYDLNPERHDGGFVAHVKNGLLGDRKDDYYDALTALIDNWEYVCEQAQEIMTERMQTRINDLTVGKPEQERKIKQLEGDKVRVASKYEDMNKNKSNREVER